jgi:serine/threonine-protein kinase
MPPVPESSPLNRTMAMPPLDPTSGPLPVSAPPPRRRRTALIAAAVVACVVAAVASQSGPTTPTAGTAPSSSASAQPSDTPSADTPSPHPTDPASMIASLRDAVAADASLSGDQQQSLLDALDKASQAVSDQNPGDAEQAIRDAQRVLRKLIKEHAVDKTTSHAWSTKLNAISTALRRSASTDSGQPSTQSGGGDNNG